MRVSLFYFTFLSVNGVLLFYYGKYLQALGLDPNQIATVCAVTPALLTFVPLIWGFLADRTGKTVVLIRVAIVCLALSLLAMTSATGYLSALISWSLYSFFGNPILPLIDSVAVAEARRTGREYARYRLWGSVSFIVSLAAFTAYIVKGGSILSVPQAALLAVLTAVVSSFLLREPVETVKRVPPTFRDAAKLFRDAPLQLFFLAGVFHQAAISPYYVFYGIHLEKLKLSETYLFGSVTCGIVAEITMFWFIGRLLRKQPLFPLMGAAFLISVVRWWLTATLTSGPALALVQTAHAFTFALCYAGSVAHIDKAVVPELRGTGRALYSGISQGVGAIAGHKLAGYLVSLYGTPAAFKAGAALEIVALAPLILSAWMEGRKALDETLQPGAESERTPPTGVVEEV